MRLLPVKAKVNSSLRLEALTELSRILKWLLKKENKRKKSIKDQAKVVLKIGSIILCQIFPKGRLHWLPVRIVNFILLVNMNSHEEIIPNKVSLCKWPAFSI